MSDSRSRTIHWADPMIGAQAARTIAGLAYLEAMARGELPPPPIMQTLGIGTAEIAEGRVVFAMEPAEDHYKPIGSVHGGVACTICDSAMACAIHTMLPAGTAYTTLELKVNYVRPLTATVL